MNAQQIAVCKFSNANTMAGCTVVAKHAELRGQLNPVVVVYWPAGIQDFPSVIWCASKAAALAAFDIEVARAQRMMGVA